MAAPHRWRLINKLKMWNYEAAGARLDGTRWGDWRGALTPDVRLHCGGAPPASSSLASFQTVGTSQFLTTRSRTGFLESCRSPVQPKSLVRWP